MKAQIDDIPGQRSPNYALVQANYDGLHDEQNPNVFQNLNPCFDRANGTTTVEKEYSLADGADAVAVINKQYANRLNHNPLDYLRRYAYAGQVSQIMDLGPDYSTAKLLLKGKFKLNDIDLIEVNEAFVAQIIANGQVFSSVKFAKKHFEFDTRIGAIERSALNVNREIIVLGASSRHDKYPPGFHYTEQTPPPQKNSGPCNDIYWWRSRWGTTFRGSSMEDAFELPISDQGVAKLVFNPPLEKANKLTLNTIQEFNQFSSKVEGDSHIQVLILLNAKKTLERRRKRRIQRFLSEANPIFRLIIFKLTKQNISKKQKASFPYHTHRAGFS